MKTNRTRLPFKYYEILGIKTKDKVRKKFKEDGVGKLRLYSKIIVVYGTLCRS